MTDLQEAMPKLTETINTLSRDEKHIMEINSNRKMNPAPCIIFMSLENEEKEINQCPLLDNQQKSPYRLTEREDKQPRIGKLIKMAYKRLEQELLAEALLTPNEVSAYKIDQHRTQAQDTNPITIRESDTEKEEHPEILGTKKDKTSQSISFNSTTASSSRHSFRSTKPNPLPSSEVSRHTSQSKSKKTKHDLRTDGSAEEYLPDDSDDDTENWNILFFERAKVNQNYWKKLKEL